MTSVPFGQGGFGDQFGAGFNNSVQKIINECLIAIGINTEDADYRERALTFLNIVYLNRLKGRHWKFTQRELFLDLHAPYSTGKISTVQGTYAVTGVTPFPTFDATMPGQMIVPAGAAIEYYRIASVETAVALTLAAKFASPSLTSSTYQVLYDRMVLEPGVLAIRSFSVSGLGEIKPTGTQEFRNRKASNPGLIGIPRWYTLVDANPQNGQYLLEIYPAPDKRYTAQLDISLRPLALQDDDETFTLIPPEHMDVLHYGVLAELYRYQENAVMMEGVGRQAAMAWSKFASDQEMTDSVARVQHSRKYFNRRRNRYAGFYGLQWFGKVDE